MAAARVWCCVLLLSAWTSAQEFTNFESPHVHPLDLSADQSLLAACNTADNRVELFSFGEGGSLQPYDSYPVGLEPVTARFRTSTELWVVNHMSDSVSVIDLTLGSVVATLRTADEPCDVVFAGTPQRAFVSCSQANTVQVFDPATLNDGVVAEIEINAEDPRALAVNSDGTEVYVAIFESGNRTTIIGGGSDGGGTITFPPNVVDDGNTPHGGVNPPFNGDGAFVPAKDPANGTAPEVGLIVRQDDFGVWRDDTGADWTAFVSGANAGQSGRPMGWTLLDHDVAVINTADLSVDYIDHLMNINMAMAVHPVTGEVTVVGTEAINEVRFEPMVNGIFVRSMAAFADPSGGAPDLTDLNPHLDYLYSTIAQTERDKSIGDPRGIVWNSTGTLGYVSGMGSNNVTVIDSDGDRAGLADVIEVGEGPTGLVLDEGRSRLYVLNKFAATISVVDLATELETAEVSFFDPSPAAIKAGRKHLYDTRKTSGLGQVSCGSCHVDARFDRLSWDLGDPSGEVKSLDGLNLGANIPGLNGGFLPFHPMKGPMSTQTLQGIIGQEPFHWRGDRLGLEEFNPAFEGLLGDDVQLTDAEMQEFEDFLETIYFPPNPFRNTDNTLPTNLDLEGHWTTGRFGTPGVQLPNGNAANGLDMYRSQARRLDAGGISCVTCHTLPSGGGTDKLFNGSTFVDIARDPDTNANTVALVSIDGSTNRSIKVPQLRNVYDKVGFTVDRLESRAGFGFLHDGSVPSIERFVGLNVFTLESDQEVADLTALMLAFSGSDFNVIPAGAPLEPPGVESRDVHAAVGQQVTVSTSAGDPLLTTYLDVVENAPNHDRVELVGKIRYSGVHRGVLYQGGASWQIDQEGSTINTVSLLALAGAGSEITFTVVPAGSGERIGLDRDGDGSYDFDEALDGSSPTLPDSDGDGLTDGEEAHTYNTNPILADTDDDGYEDGEEILAGTDPTDEDSLPTDVVYVDFTHAGKETGAPAYPFNDVGSAALLVTQGGAVMVQAWAGVETVTISKAMTLQSVGGTARIGGPE